MTADTLVYDIGNSRYINLTDRCTLRCQFCPKHNGSTQVHDYQLKLSKRPTAEVIIPLLENPAQYKEVVFCGFGEPTLNLKTLLSVAHYVKAHGGNVRVNTDGLGNRLHKRNILPELAACVDRLSISLNAQNEDVYNIHCKPQLPNAYQELLDFIKLSPHYIKHVTITAIEGLPGVDTAACEKIAKQAGVHFKKRFLDQVG
ncbi:TatD family nuclease-associated radical SAM protein [Zooshikella ganghwensis]|uniref:TatD family nuclease-associated radical SAM protein n=1 Tax=Zooshikella ganghwensis TaxID=202772 RepID=UPI000419DD12|nr:TatD family nuclease-associated radical SAM protein [Zooshikella ganghwensis]